MKERTLAVFHDSLDRCMRSAAFLDAFYERMMASSEEIAALFAETDMTRQKRLLKASLYFCLAAIADYDEARDYLYRLGQKHRTYGVRLEHYDVWLKTLLAVAAEFDPLFDSQIAAAWHAVMDPSVGLLRSGHASG